MKKLNKEYTFDNYATGKHVKAHLSIYIYTHGKSEDVPKMAEPISTACMDWPHSPVTLSTLRFQWLSFNRASRHDSAIFQLALKATRKLWLLPLAANSPYRQSNLIFRSS